jgi:hypothetical protein
MASTDCLYLPALKLPHEQQMLQEHLLLQDSDMLLDVCEGLGFAADDPWRQQQVLMMRQRRQSYTSTAAVRTGSSSEQQEAEDGGEGEQSLVEVAATGEAVRQDSMLQPVGSASLQVRVGCNDGREYVMLAAVLTAGL